MIIGFALVLTLLQVRASFAVPLTQLQADLNNLQNFSTQHLPWHPATAHPQLRATPQPVYIKTGFSEPGLVQTS